jgi:hypothetical protein
MHYLFYILYTFRFITHLQGLFLQLDCRFIHLHGLIVHLCFITTDLFPILSKTQNSELFSIMAAYPCPTPMHIVINA